MRFFELRPDEDSRRSGRIDGAHRWSLPGGLCSVCRASRGGLGETYPSIDLSSLVEAHSYEEARQEPLEEYERLREQVRPLAPRDAPLFPGAGFGPFIGRASGSFGDFHWPMPWHLVVQRLVMERLQAEGVRGLRAFPMELRLKGKHPPELLDLEIPVRGQLHPDCLPPGRSPPCPRCGREDFSLPETLTLDSATLPEDVDVFRLRDFTTVIVGTERFVNAVEKLGLDEVVFSELKAR